MASHARRSLPVSVARADSEPRSRRRRMSTESARREALHAWQLFYNMQPRSDSRLTEMFVRGEVSWGADEVARELMATDFIYQNTLYGEVIEEFLRCVAARLREEHKLSWKATWDIVRFYGPVALKLLCVERHGLAIPPHLPPGGKKTTDP